MKIDFENHDSTLQIKNLKDLLQKEKPMKEDLALAMFLIILIFYENRPGKIKDLHEWYCYGTGCHNPTSEKTGEIIMGIWRLEITIGHSSGSKLDIKYEYVVPGYLRAVFKNKGKEYIIGADIKKGNNKGEMLPTFVTISPNQKVLYAYKNNKILMQELSKLLNEPLEKIVSVNDSVIPSRFPGRVKQFLKGTGDW